MLVEDRFSGGSWLLSSSSIQVAPNKEGPVKIRNIKEEDDGKKKKQSNHVAGM